MVLLGKVQVCLYSRIHIKLFPNQRCDGGDVQRRNSIIGQFRRSFFGC
jgi:hypothetical protein